MKLSYPFTKPALPIAIAAMLFITACNDQIATTPPGPETPAHVLPMVEDEIAQAEQRVLELLLDEPNQASINERIGMTSHPGRDALVRYLETRSDRSQRDLLASEEEYEFSDEEEVLIDEFLEARPDVDEAIGLIVEDFDAAFENIDQLPMEIEITDETGTVTGTETIYPENGYYHLEGVTVSALEVLHDQQQAVSDPTRTGARTLGLWRTSKRLWNNRTVKYFVDSKGEGWSASSALRNRVKDRFYLELNDLSQATGIRFKRYNNNLWRQLRWRTSRSYVKVEFGGYESECPLACANVGRSRKGRVHFNMNHGDLGFLKASSYSRTNPSLSHITHELMHTLGMKHEHQRPDRNQFVKVDLICDGSARNCSTVDPNTYGSPYDYNSVMHYATETDFCDRTNIIKNPSHERRGCQFWSQNKVLYGTWLTPWDIYGVKYLYEVSNNSRPNYTPGTD